MREQDVADNPRVAHQLDVFHFLGRNYLHVDLNKKIKKTTELKLQLSPV